MSGNGANGEVVGLTLAGGGARGAYEAGALSVLLPELDRRGQRPTIYIGTSVGAMNGGILASRQHLPVEEAVSALLDIWHNATKGQIFRPVAPQGLILAAQYLGEVLSIPRVRMEGLIDPEPLKRNLETWVDWPNLHRNIREGAVRSMAMVATSARTGRTVVFVEEPEERAMHRSHAVAYVPTQLDTQHVSASFAVPAVFPPVRVTEPARVTGWYFDGGTRLNAPIKPALDLGSDRLVVVACDSITGPVMDEDPREDPPDLVDGIVHLLEGTLVDPLIEDMRRLGNVNQFFTHPREMGARAYRTTRGKTPYKKVPYVFVGPQHRGALGRMAADVMRRRYGGLKGLRSPDWTLMSRLLGGETPQHGELLSILFIEHEFIEELIELGQRDARAWLDEAHDDEGPWQLGPLGTFTRPREWTAG